MESRRRQPRGYAVAHRRVARARHAADHRSATLSLHPDGLAPRIANLAQWRPYLLQRLQRECELTGDARLSELLDELRAYPVPRGTTSTTPLHGQGESRVFVPLQLHSTDGLLSFISTTTVFGTPVDVTVAEIALECFFPADAATAEHLRRLIV